MDPSDLRTLGIGSAAGDLVGPEIVTGLIRLAVKEVYIMLAHHIGRHVKGVGDVAVRNEHITQLQMKERELSLEARSLWTALPSPDVDVPPEDAS